MIEREVRKGLVLNNMGSFDIYEETRLEPFRVTFKEDMHTVFYSVLF